MVWQHVIPYVFWRVGGAVEEVGHIQSETSLYPNTFGKFLQQAKLSTTFSNIFE